MMLLLELARDVAVSTVLLYSGARILKDQVRCEEWEHAVRAAFVYVGVSHLMWRLALVLAIFPALLVAHVPLIGTLLLVLGGLFGSFGVTCLSLWVTQIPLEGEFKIHEPIGAVALGAWVWCCHFALFWVG